MASAATQPQWDDPPLIGQPRRSSSFTDAAAKQSSSADALDRTAGSKAGAVSVEAISRGSGSSDKGTDSSDARDSVGAEDVIPPPAGPTEAVRVNEELQNKLDPATDLKQVQEEEEEEAQRGRSESVSGRDTEEGQRPTLLADSHQAGPPTESTTTPTAALSSITSSSRPCTASSDATRGLVGEPASTRALQYDAVAVDDGDDDDDNNNPDGEGPGTGRAAAIGATMRSRENGSEHDLYASRIRENAFSASRDTTDPTPNAMSLISRSVGTPPTSEDLVHGNDASHPTPDDMYSAPTEKQYVRTPSDERPNEGELGKGEDKELEEDGVASQVLYGHTHSIESFDDLGRGSASAHQGSFEGESRDEIVLSPVRGLMGGSHVPQFESGSSRFFGDAADKHTTVPTSSSGERKSTSSAESSCERSVVSPEMSVVSGPSDGEDDLWGRKPPSPHIVTDVDKEFRFVRRTKMLKPSTVDTSHVYDSNSASLRQFVVSPIPGGPGHVGRFIVTRDRQAMNRLAPVYTLYLNHKSRTAVAYCRKIMRSRRSHYVFSMNREDLFRARADREAYLGKLRLVSDPPVREYVLFGPGDAPSPRVSPRDDQITRLESFDVHADDIGVRTQLAVIAFDPDSPKRKMEVCVPAVNWDVPESVSYSAYGTRADSSHGRNFPAPSSPDLPDPQGDHDLVRKYRIVKLQGAQNATMHKAVYFLNRRANAGEDGRRANDDDADWTQRQQLQQTTQQQQPKSSSSVRSLKNVQLVQSAPSDAAKLPQYYSVGAGEFDRPPTADPDDPYHRKAVLLQMGKIDDGSFSLNVQFPLTPLQAFAISIARFDAPTRCL